MPFWEESQLVQDDASSVVFPESSIIDAYDYASRASEEELFPAFVLGSYVEQECCLQLLRSVKRNWSRLDVLC